MCFSWLFFDLHGFFGFILWVSILLWWGTEEGSWNQRWWGDSPKERFGPRIFHFGIHNLPQSNQWFFTAIYEVNTFQGSLGSSTATVASTSNTRSVSFWVRHWIFMRLHRGVLSYKIYAVHKKKIKLNPNMSTPPTGKKLKCERVQKRNSPNSKLRLQFLSTHHGFYIFTRHIKSTMNNAFFLLLSQICTYEIKFPRKKTNKKKNATSLNVIYWGVLFWNPQTGDPNRDPGKADRVWGSPVDAVGVHTTGQTNMEGMHWSNFRVTVECEEDRYNTNLNGGSQITLQIRSVTIWPFCVWTLMQFFFYLSTPGKVRTIFLFTNNSIFLLLLLKTGIQVASCTMWASWREIWNPYGQMVKG